MPGTLYLCATPIGNLGDITQRVLDTLREVDLIAAEDTRNTLRLLNHFEIKKPMTSYHEHNKFEKARELLARLHRGENIAVVTDAGTPAISDPGEVLAALCIEEGIRVTSLPGACALITALTMSGMPARRFCFEGFLPPEKTDKKSAAGSCSSCRPRNGPSSSMKRRITCGGLWQSLPKTWAEAAGSLSAAN